MVIIIKNGLQHIHLDILIENIFNNFDGFGHPSTKGSVIIGNDVWIANNSHVVKDVKPYSLVGGNPAKFISYRHTEQQIQELLKIKW